MEKDLNDWFSKIPVYVGILKEKGRDNKIETWKTRLMPRQSCTLDEVTRGGRLSLKRCFQSAGAETSQQPLPSPKTLSRVLG